MITIFGASWCSGCKQVKDFAESSEKEFRYVDIDTPEGNEEFKNAGKFRSVPVTIIQDGDAEMCLIGASSAISAIKGLK